MQISSFLRDKKIRVLDSEYTESVEITIVVEKELTETVNDTLVNITNGTVEKTDETFCMYAL